MHLGCRVKGGFGGVVFRMQEREREREGEREGEREREILRNCGCRVQDGLMCAVSVGIGWCRVKSGFGGGGV